jgi:hypothetical protein
LKAQDSTTYPTGWQAHPSILKEFTGSPPNSSAIVSKFASIQCFFLIMYLDQQDFSQPWLQKYYKVASFTLFGVRVVWSMSDLSPFSPDQHIKLDLAGHYVTSYAIAIQKPEGDATQFGGIYAKS